MPILAADGRGLGTFANYYREPQEPTERDLEVISMVTRTTAIAIEEQRFEPLQAPC
ncbi:GAF domain-containing protein [Pararhizobium polonicum]|uniref:GAF domain-containing protein n=1 Tax=Pararhizobium polonicum TaxID=1612624 RepID=UPI0011124882|nr:GAF domain-containing protein [Pararhizobium polonicum]